MSNPKTKIIGVLRIIKREVITEKYNIEHQKRDFLIRMLNNCEILTNSDWPDSIFYRKNGEILFEKNSKYKEIYIKYDKIWQVFEREYGMNTKQIQVFTKSMMEYHINSEGYTTPSLMD